MDAQRVGNLGPIFLASNLAKILSKDKNIEKRFFLSFRQDIAKYIAAEILRLLLYKYI